MTLPAFLPPTRIPVRPAETVSRLRPWFPRVARVLARPYLRMVGYQGMTLRGQAGAARLWEEFHAGKNRLIVAFRHPYGNDPQVVATAILWGIRTKRVPFVQFVHGVEVGWWAGALARWALVRSGGLPVDHGRLGPSQVDAIREAMAHGRHPLALAPEGQVSYSSWEVQKVEPGFARLGFLAAEELEREGRPEPVLVLPVSLYHRYSSVPDKRWDRVLTRVERSALGKVQTGAPWERLNRLREELFLKAEAWYAQNHGYRTVGGSWSRDRLLPLLEAALGVAERILGLPHGGEYFARLYKVRTTGWARLVPARPEDPRPTELDRRLAYRSLAEAWSAFRHMELADLGWFLGTDDLGPESSVTRLADQAENLYDLMVRLSGGNVSHRKVLFPRKVEVVFGAPLNLSARLGDYRTRKKETLARTVADLVDEWHRANPEDAHAR